MSRKRLLLISDMKKSPTYLLVVLVKRRRNRLPQWQLQVLHDIACERREGNPTDLDAEELLMEVDTWYL